MNITALNTQIDKFTEALRSNSESAYYHCVLVLFGLLFLSISVQWAISPVIQVTSSPDIIGYIDAGYRITSGQVPHNDFTTLLGPVFSYLYAIGVGLFGPSISAVVNSNLLMMAITTLVAWLLSSQRLSPFLALIFSATVMMTTSGVVPLGWGAHWTGYAMSYNRHAFGLLMCICVGSFFQKRGSFSRVVDCSEGLLIGALVSFLFLLKLNFFVMGVCVLVISPLFVGLNFKKSAWIFLGFLLPILLFWFALGVKPEAFYNDMSFLYNIVRETRPPLLGSIWKLITNLIIPISIVLFIIVVSGWLCFQKGAPHSLVRSFAAAVFLLAADLVLGISNTQLPILVFLPFISIIALRELLIVDNCRSGILSALIIFTFLLSTVTIVRETSYIAYAFYSKLSADPIDVEATRIDSPLLKNVYVPSSQSEWTDYPLSVNEGLRLLKRHVTPSSKLVTLSISNPFHFVLGLKPTNGTQLFWWIGADYTSKHHLPAAQVLSNADLILVSKPWYRAVSSYRDYIMKQFKVVEDSQYWVLFRRVSQ